MSDFAVELQDVVKRFPTPEGGEVFAVNHVTMQIKDGEFFSMLGSSGCGKTTSLRVVAGFEWPTSGEVFIQGVPQGHSPPFKRPVNTVFQNYALFQHMSVERNVAFGLEMDHVPKPEIKQRVGEALEMVKLSGMERRTPRQLSGGQQQRIALARALVKRPQVLLLDEPLGALDLKLRKEMQLELKALQQEVGITFIYVTHDQEEALTMSDRIAVMSQGEVLQIGTPIEIYERPCCKFVANFIGITNFMEGTLKSLDKVQASVHVPAFNAEIQGIAVGKVKVGDTVTVSIRPEKIHVTEEAAFSHNCFEGTLSKATYIGPDTHLVVDVNGLKLKVWEQNKISILDPATYYTIGQKVWLTLLPENTLLLVNEKVSHVETIA